MPRIYNASADAIDFCKKHFPTEERAVARFSLEATEHLPRDGTPREGPDGRGDCFGHDCAHPPYSEAPGEYRCHDCGCPLTSSDD